MFGSRTDVFGAMGRFDGLMSVDAEADIRCDLVHGFWFQPDFSMQVMKVRTDRRVSFEGIPHHGKIDAYADYDDSGRRVMTVTFATGQLQAIEDQTSYLLFEIATNVFRCTNRKEMFLLSGPCDRTVCFPKLRTPPSRTA